MTLVFISALAALSVAFPNGKNPFVGPNARQEGFQHEVLFVEDGVQAGDTRAAIRANAQTLQDIIDTLESNVVDAVQADGQAIRDTFEGVADDIAAELGVQYQEIVDGAQQRAEQLHADIGAQFGETRDLVDDRFDELDSEQGAQSNQTFQYITEEGDALLEAAEEVDDVVAAMIAAKDAVEATVVGAQTAAELIAGIGPQIAEDLDHLLNVDFPKIDDFAEAEIRQLRATILQALLTTRDSVNARDAELTRVLDVVKSGAVLNSLLIERNRDLLQHFKSSTTSETSTSSFSSFRNH